MEHDDRYNWRRNNRVLIYFKYKQTAPPHLGTWPRENNVATIFLVNKECYIFIYYSLSN